MNEKTPSPVLNARAALHVEGRTRRTALRFVLLVGILSFFADFTYEGSRSILGLYLALLQASGTIVGVVTGFGELLGYGLRLVSGRFADATRLYWPITIFGYVVQMASVPALALVDSWPAAAVLIVLERVGRAIRNPPRDMMLSYAGKQIGGYGWAFWPSRGNGPMRGDVRTIGGSRSAGLSRRLPPSLRLARVSGGHQPQPGCPGALPLSAPAGPRDGTAGHRDNGAVTRLLDLSRRRGTCGRRLRRLPNHRLSPRPRRRRIRRGYRDLLRRRHGRKRDRLLLLGRLFDRFGFSVLIGLTLVSALFAPLVFLGGFSPALVGVAIWGLGS
jgi:hypothetical protein